MSIKAVNRNSKWWRRQSWHRSVKKCGQSVKYCSTSNQLKWEVLLQFQPTKVRSIQLIEATGLHYHFRLQLLQLCFRWGEHGNMLTIWRICTAAKGNPSHKAKNKNLNKYNIMLLSCISIEYTCSTIWNQSLLPVFLYLYPATEHWDIGHLTHMIFVNNNKLFTLLLVYWDPKWHHFFNNYKKLLKSTP